ncbi:uncharacterized protein LOC119666452 [Teleopsis dalmanni]|uniref:uncharacterized protein LOC119666452 n=1 Tax=Teleopsis dalmanni TaxID=139649 RepID=UPI0018CFCF30|nr:uncharacterized protein LOC119666452 [Teleopsis dalmanni]
MERMWRKVNHSFSGRTSKSANSIQSTDTVSSAGGFGDGQIVVAVAGIAAPSTATGRRLAASGQVQMPTNSAIATGTVTGQCQKSLSQHVLLSTASSSERRRRRRRKSRQRRSGVSCVGGGDNMSSSGGFYTIKESSGVHSGSHRHHRQSHSSNHIMASSAPSGTVMMYPNPVRENSTTASGAAITSAQPTPSTAPDISLRQRAVAKLRMFNFHLNWDLHMTPCKPCGITRRLCRNRRREDNELYRSNSFKFERFERKECIEELSDSLQKQIR